MSNNKKDINRFQNLSFEGFRELAKDNSLSPYEKIGFPDSYRKGREKAIFDDILGKLPQLEDAGKRVLDIGPGCSDLIGFIIELCRNKKHELYLVDSAEMLNHIPDQGFIKKVAGYYPEETLGSFKSLEGKFDCIITYSVLHYIFEEGNLFRFIDRSLDLLAPGGSFLIGDIPNITKRNRFFASPTGVAYHKAYTKSDTEPEPLHFEVAHDKLDDGVLMGIIQRCRSFGYEAYLLPQRGDLPMANRREDILIVKN